ncbi:hypothetical protein IJH26_00600 [Candidatus Saccharibacteria bacterium]|nr:hypothetical protein [Candidatus Saccharibacteria bacterium]
MKRFLMVMMVLALGFVSIPVSAISDTQKESIIEKCDNIKTNLKTVQRNDSRARVFLGAYYETILTRYITPLNIKLVEKNLSNAGFVENQNGFASGKTIFANDFTKYQQMLEELVAVDCKTEPEKFYNELVDVRKRRKIMEQDVLKMRQLISEQIKLVEGLRGKI